MNHPDGIHFTYLKNFETGLLTKMENELKHLDEGYYQKLKEYKPKSDKVADFLVSELEEHASKDRKRILSIQETYIYLKRCITIREEQTNEISRLKQEIENLKELI